MATPLVKKPKKASNRNLRIGTVVETEQRGIGIIVWRNKKECWVAHPYQQQTLYGELTMACRWQYKSFEGITLSEQTMDSLDAHFVQGAWNSILGEADQNNWDWELERSRKALANLPRLQGVTYTKRNISFPYGSADYLRITMAGVFDFEISTYPTVSVGLKELFDGMVSLWNGKGYENIKLLNYNGNFFREQAEWRDYNYGMAYSWAGEKPSELAEAGA